MKKYTIYFLSFLCFSFIACSSDDDSCSGKTEAISIEVEGVEMSNITGTASINQSLIGINISGNSTNESEVFFSSPNAVGTYDLNLDFSGELESRTVTAFVPDGFVNIILSSGCYEVVSIDATDVVMRFNINENDTSINGEISLEVN